MKQLIQDQTHKDPVCGMEVSYKTAAELYTYNHGTYYFCASVCQQAFEMAPEEYIHCHRQHGMKPR